MTPSEAFRQGMHQTLPAVLGILTFGTITGVATVSAGFSVPAAIAIGIIVYAGTATLVAMQLILMSAPLAMIALAATVMNLRFVLYSLTNEPLVRGRSRRFRALYAYIMSDTGFGMTAARLANQVPDDHIADYVMGANIVIYCWWAAGVVAGSALGATIPADWSLDFIVTLTFLGLGISTVRDRPMLAAFVTAGLIAVLTRDWPYRSGLMAATAAGIAAGLLTEARNQGDRR